MIRVNLLPESVLEHRRRRRRSVLWTRIAVGYAGMWIVAAALTNEMVQDPTAVLDTKASGINAEITSAQASTELLETERDRLRSRLRVVRDITGQPDWSILIRHLADQAGDAIGLRGVAIGVKDTGPGMLRPGHIARGPFEIRVIGVASSQAEATTFALELENAGLFRSLDLTQTSPTRVAEQNAVLFELVGEISAEGTP